MSEMIEKNEYKKINSIPKNVRQIGEVEEGIKIYMEDYVYTYLHQYAAKNKNEGQAAFLIGEKCIYENQQVIFINGAIQGKFLINENGNLKITEDTWIYVYEKIRQYFNGYEIMGWVFTQPGYGIILTSFLIKQHKENFKGDNQVLFIIDPIEKEEAFFILEENDLKKKKGYLIYYEKNTKMHEYMLDYKIVMGNAPIIMNNNENDIVTSYRLKDQERKEEVYHKKFVNMLSAVCGALVIISIIIGVGLLSNMEQMNKLKQSFEYVISNYSTSENDKKTENAEKINHNLENKVEDNNINPAINEESNNELNTEVEKTEQTPLGTEKDTPVIDQEDYEMEDINEQNVEEAIVITPKTYLIKTGDSLLSISYKFYNNKEMVRAIQDINNIENPDKIYVGQEIMLPQP